MRLTKLIITLVSVSVCVGIFGLEVQVSKCWSVRIRNLCLSNFQQLQMIYLTIYCFIAASDAIKIVNFINGLVCVCVCVIDKETKTKFNSKFCINLFVIVIMLIKATKKLKQLE